MAATVPPGCPLTPRQYAALSLVADGLQPTQVAARLHITHSTVRDHLAQACRRLRTPGLPQAVAYLGRHGWHHWKPPPELPLAKTHPFLHAYLREFDRWLASGMKDRRARNGMLIALWGHQTTKGPDEP